MKRLLICLILISVLCAVFVSCKKAGNISYAPYSADDNYTDILFDTDSSDSTASVVSEEPLKIWGSYPDYTNGIPDSGFFTESPALASFGGNLVLIFTTDTDVTLNELTEYLLTLEEMGFSNLVLSEGDDVCEGKIYKQNSLVFEYTYRYGAVVFELFKNGVTE